MIAAQGTQRLPAAAASWLQPLSALGVDGLIALLALLVATDPLLSRIGALQQDDRLFWACWSLLTLLLGWRLWRHCRERWLRWSARHLRPLLLILGIALASPLWSLDPSQSAERAVWLVQSTFLGFFVGYRFYGRDLQALLLAYFGVLLLGNGLLSLLAGSEIKGLLWKNEFGFVMAVAAAYCLIAALYRRLPLVLALSLLAVALAALVAAGSASGIVVTAVAFALIMILWVGRMLRMSAVLAVVMIVVAPFAIVAVIDNLDAATALVDRDPSLTQRTPVWRDALQVIAERPLTGFGLDAVWGDREATAFPYLPTLRVAAHAHDGYLDLATELGLPAATLAAAWFLVLLFRALDAYTSTRSAVALFGFVFLNSFLLYTVVEVGWFQCRRMEWILCVAVIVAMLRRAGEEQAGPPRPRSAAGPRDRQASLSAGRAAGRTAAGHVS